MASLFWFTLEALMVQFKVTQSSGAFSRSRPGYFPQAVVKTKHSDTTEGGNVNKEKVLKR